MKIVRHFIALRRNTADIDAEIESLQIQVNGDVDYSCGNRAQRARVSPLIIRVSAPAATMYEL